MILKPYKIKEYTLKNRIVMAPMCMYSAKDGLINLFHEVHYLERALSGVGLIILESTAISLNARITLGDLGIWNNKQTKLLKSLVSKIHILNTHVSIHLVHAGRKSLVKPNYVPSPIPYDESTLPPKELTIKEIESIIKSFGKTDKRANKARFDGLELQDLMAI